MSGPALKNLTDQTVTAIQNMIYQSGLNPGEPFAREADLEKQLKVSRVVLREALSRPRAIGLVESRQRVGLIVAKPDPVNLFEQSIAGSNLDSLDLEQLADLRYALEIGAIDLAIRRAVATARLRAIASVAWRGRTDGTGRFVDSKKIHPLCHQRFGSRHRARTH